MQELPDSLFLPITSNRLVDPIVLWTKGNDLDATWAANNAYCIRQENEPLEAYGAETRTQFADRYGGYGIGYGGGSGRCATFGNIQTKGVGRTPLVTPKNDHLHNTGTTWRAEAAYEAIWSELFATVLPHGVVKSLAVLTTEGKSQLPTSNWKRTLLLREFAIRPAHFLRNIYFRSEPGRDGLTQDAVRCQEFIRNIHLIFEISFPTETRSTTGIETINSGLKAMAKRFSEQVSASFAKRLFHGALNSSNIALDGRYIDFGVASFVETYKKRGWRLAAENQDQWNQGEALLKTMHALRFHIQKYWGRDINGLITDSEISSEFNSTLSATVELELLKMTGLPMDDKDTYNAKDLSQLYQCMRRIYTEGPSDINQDLATFSNTDIGKAFSKLDQKYNLNEILAISSTCDNPNELDISLKCQIRENTLRNQFVECYSAVANSYRAKFGHLSKRGTNLYLAFQANRLNADLHFLKKTQLLDVQLNAFEESMDGLPDFITSTINNGSYFLASDFDEFASASTVQKIEITNSISQSKHVAMATKIEQLSRPSIATNRLRCMITAI